MIEFKFKGVVNNFNIDAKNGDYIINQKDGKFYKFENGWKLLTDIIISEEDFRPATDEELDSVNNYIDSISKKTGINIYDLLEKQEVNHKGELLERKVYDYCPYCGSPMKGRC